MNQNRILEVTQEYMRSSFESSKRKTYILNALGLPTMVMTTDVANVTYILKTNFENFGKSGTAFKTRFQGLLGDGIFNADGQQWFAHRKTSAHLFKLSEFKTTILETFNHDLTTVLEVIQGHCDKQESFDIHALMHKFTLESIAYIAFGLHLGCITNDDVQFAADFDYCTACINDSMINPIWRLERYFTPRGWMYFYRLFRINRFSSKIITERRAQMKQQQLHRDGGGGGDGGDCDGDSNNSVRRSDLLSLYLDKDNFTSKGKSGEEEEEVGSKKSGGSSSSSTSSAGGGSAAGGSAGAGYKDAFMEPTDKNLRDVILNMIIAGRDTTAQALSWTIFRLCTHPETQLKMREEILSVVQNDSKTHSQGQGFMSYAALQQLRYTEAVCMEALRLHPSVPKEAKCVLRDDLLPDGTALRRGDMACFLPWAMGRDADLWGTDACEFRPERFLDQPKPSPFVYTAFQAGPRACLGQNFALLEMKCALARLCARFEFSLMQPALSVTYANSLTLPIKGR